MFRKGKYVVTDANEAILFPDSMNHSEFKSFGIKSAGFFSVTYDAHKNGGISVSTYGESVSLNMEPKPGDSIIIAKLILTTRDLDSLGKPIDSLIGRMKPVINKLMDKYRLDRNRIVIDMINELYKYINKMRI